MTLGRPKRWPAAAALACWIASALLLHGCASRTPGSVPPAVVSAARPAAPDPAQAYERDLLDRLANARRMGHWADAATSLELLATLRPDSAAYRADLLDVRRVAGLAAAERLQRAAQAQRRGDVAGAEQAYLAALAADPDNTEAAQALRALERDRNRRQFLGRPSRMTLLRRDSPEALAMAPDGVPADRNELEHAALLTAQGEVDAAIALLEERMTRGPDTTTRRLLADACQRKADTLIDTNRDEAIRLLRRSVELDPKPETTRRLRQWLAAKAPPPAPASR
jgi:tetratricopeptide (TPR) repeat protein